MAYNLKPSYVNIDEIDSRDKALTVLYGRRSDGALIPINIDNNGNIVIGTGIVLAPSDIKLGAVEIQDNDSGIRTDVIQIGDSISFPPYSGTSDNYRGFLILGKSPAGNAQPLSFDSSGSLYVTTVSPIYNTYNQFGATSTIDGSWSTIITKSILAGETLCVLGFTVWGDADAEWSLEKTSAQIGGVRTSPSRLSETVIYKVGPKVVGPDVVTIKVKHYYSGKTVDFYTNLESRII